MRKRISVRSLTKRLQKLLDAVGEEAFPAQKRMLLDGLQVVDAKGEPVDMSDLDITLTPASKADDDVIEEEDDEMVEKEVIEEDEVVEDEETPLDEKQTELLDELEEDEEEEVETATYRPRKSVRELVRKEIGMANRPAVKVKDLSSFRFGSIKNFRGDNAEEQAYRFGRWAFGAMGHKKSASWCANNGIQIKTHNETVNSQGGYLVPDEFSDALISLREQFGVFRAHAKIEPMASDTKRIPRRDSTVAASFVGESVAGTETTQAFSQVNLIAKKLMVLTRITSELQEDAMINLGDSIAGEIAYAFSSKEDDCGFNGDGTSAFGGIVGLDAAILAGGTVDSGAASIATVTAAQVSTFLAALPQYADTPNTKFFMHKSMYHALLERLMLDQGGSPGREMVDGFGVPTFMGYPVIFSQKMTTSVAGGAGDTLMYFGDMSLTSYMGDRRSNTIAFSDSALNAFEQDELLIRGTERFDIVNTNVGSATANDAGAMIKFTL